MHTEAVICGGKLDSNFGFDMSGDRLDGLTDIFSLSEWEEPPCPSVKAEMSQLK